MSIVKHRKVEAWATIEGFGEVPITQLNVTYALNRVPTGSITLAMGRDSNGVKAAMHERAHALVKKLKTQVFLKVGGYEEMVFDGFTSGTPYVRSYDSISFSVGLIGWLDDLMNSSALSRLFAVGAPSDFFASASSDYTGVAIYSSPGAGELLIRKNPAEDLWTASKDALIFLCEDSLLSKKGDEAATGAAQNRPLGADANTPAIEALKRFTGDKLTIATDTALMKGSIGLQVGNIIFDPRLGETIWSKVMMIADMFGFAIVPQIQHARAVAWAPVLKPGLIQMEIAADSFASISGAHYSRDQLRGAILLAAGEGQTGVIDSDPRSFNKTLSRYLIGEVGQILTARAPSWLTGLVSSQVWTPRTTGQGGKGIRSTGKPDGAAGTDSMNKDATEATETETLGERYAQSFFMSNLLAGRTLSIVGRLRADIAPGSPVKIEVGGTGLYDKQTLYGNVNAVTISAETQGPSAATVFGIDNYYVEEEGEYALDEHPLFDTPFLGAGLVGGGEEG